MEIRQVLQHKFTNQNLDHFKVPAYAISPEGENYKIIGISKDFELVNNTKFISFDESSEADEVTLFFIGQCESIFTLPTKIKRVRGSNQILLFHSQKIILANANITYISVIGGRIIMNNFPLKLSYQHSFRTRFFIRETTQFIGISAFCRNYNIAAVVIPSSVDKISDYSFYECCSLRNIIFKRNSKLKTIGSGSFMCTNVESFGFPSCVDEIGFLALSNISNLKKISFTTDSKLKVIEKYCFQYSNVVFLEIPSSVEVIEDFSFRECKNLRSIKFTKESRLKKIGEQSFLSTAIECVDIPSGVEEIGYMAFSSCNNLKFLTFSSDSKLKIVGNSAFTSAVIEYVDFPTSIEEIGNMAFKDSKNLRSVSFRDKSKLRRIGKEVFLNCPIFLINLYS